MSRKLRIAVDMDEVLADALGKQLRAYNEHFGAQVTSESLHGLELADIVPVVGESVLARAPLGTQITQKAVDQIVVSCHAVTVLHFVPTEKSSRTAPAGISLVRAKM